MKAELIQEEFSKAWLYVMASSAGCTVEYPVRDINSVDAKIASDISGKMWTSGCSIEVQLKCTKNKLRVKDKDNLSYDLKIKNYDELRANSACPRILILLTVPEKRSDWVVAGLAQTTIKEAALWVSIAGMPPTKNKKTIAIDVPKKNVVTPAVVKKLIKQVADTGILS